MRAEDLNVFSPQFPLDCITFHYCRERQREVDQQKVEARNEKRHRRRKSDGKRNSQRDGQRKKREWGVKKRK